MKLSSPLHHETTSIKVTIYSPVVKFSRNLSNVLFYLNSSEVFPLANTSPLFETLSTLVFITSVSLLTHLAIFFLYAFCPQVLVFTKVQFLYHIAAWCHLPHYRLQIYTFRPSLSARPPYFHILRCLWHYVECLAQCLTQSKHSIMLTTVFITVSTWKSHRCTSILMSKMAHFVFSPS